MSTCAGSDPSIGFNYLGRLGAARAADMSGDLWRISQDGLSVADAATAVPMPLGHTVELNAATVDTDTGPQLHATWTWAPLGTGSTRRSAGSASCGSTPSPASAPTSDTAAAD